MSFSSVLLGIKAGAKDDNMDGGYVGLGVLGALGWFFSLFSVFLLCVYFSLVFFFCFCFGFVRWWFVSDLLL